MIVKVDAAPCMLLETVELLYAFVNDIPVRELTAERPYCIPKEDVRKILDAACAGLSKEDPELLFYFQKDAIQDESGECTCIARNLAYNTMDLGCNTLEESVQALKKGWHTLRQNRERFSVIGPYCVDYTAGTEQSFMTMAQALEKLNVTATYRQKLLEAFSGFDDHAERLGQLIAPVAARLEALLEPWVRRAEPLAQEWEFFFSQPDWPEQLQGRSSLSALNVYQVMYVRLRYLQSAGAPGKVDEATQTVYFHMGVSRSIKPGDSREFDFWEYRALRLMGSPARVKMLRAMMEQPMTSREMSQQLSLHLGAVGRDVRSLFDARLLIVEFANGRNRYRTNPDALRTIAKHLLDMAGGEAQP